MTPQAFQERSYAAYPSVPLETLSKAHFRWNVLCAQRILEPAVFQNSCARFRSVLPRTKDPDRDFHHMQAQNPRLSGAPFSRQRALPVKLWQDSRDLTLNVKAVPKED